jgi:hypothetical protein
VVERFASWIYSGNIVRNTLETNADTFIGMWLFADRYQVPLLKNEMIDELNQSIIDSGSLPTHRLADIYAKTDEHSTLRLMIVDAMSFCLDEDSVSEAEHWPPAALADTLKAIVVPGAANPFPDSTYKFQNMCPEFHSHNSRELCPVKEGRSTRGEIEWC